MQTDGSDYKGSHEVGSARPYLIANVESFEKASFDLSSMSDPSSEQSSVTTVFLTPSSSINSSGLQIPEAKDGFFGYTDEKSLQQV